LRGEKGFSPEEGLNYFRSITYGGRHTWDQSERAREERGVNLRRLEISSASPGDSEEGGERGKENARRKRGEVERVVRADDWQRASRRKGLSIADHYSLHNRRRKKNTSCCTEENAEEGGAGPGKSDTEKREGGREGESLHTAGRLVK